jgi:hypothetical protein
VTLQVVPEGLAATSAAVEAITARLAAVHAGAAPLITTVAPPAADPVSVNAAAMFSARGAQHETAGAQGVDVLGRAGMGVAAAGTGYSAADTAAAATYLVAGG